MTALIIYDTACRALAEARSVDEVKDIRDKAVAMQAYARQAKNRDLEADAVEIRLRATRRLDQLRVAQKETVGLNRGAAGGGARAGLRGALTTPRDTRPTLASQGIDKNLAKQARTLGALSDDKFEAVITDARDKVSRAVKLAMREAKLREKREAISRSMGTPTCLLPSPGEDRKKRVTREPAKRQWTLWIGPSITAEALKEKEAEARRSPMLRPLLQHHESLLQRIAALEAELKATREQADAARSQLSVEIRRAVGPVITNTYTLQADTPTDAELAALDENQRVERLLLAATGERGDGLEAWGSGIWGDMCFMLYGLPMPSEATP
jgi:hypothetical protein